MLGLKKYTKRLRVHHYIVFAMVLAIGIFNAVTALTPVIQQRELEKNIALSFEKWWQEEGMPQFKVIGLPVNDSARAIEFAQYRERVLSAGKSFDTEERIKSKKKEFREWWEIGGGKELYTKEHGVYPKEAQFEKELNIFIKNYTDQFPRYAMAFVPKEGEYGRLLTCWILFPSWASFLLFALFFLFAYIKLSDRWGVIVSLAIFFALAIFGGCIIDVFTGTSFFSPYVAERYMGASIALAFMLGATAFENNAASVPPAIRGAAIIGLILDVAVNWVVNPGIFGAVAVASIPFFGLGAFAGIKMPARRKSLSEQRKDALEIRMKRSAQRNITAERHAKTRENIDEGFGAAQKGHYDAAKLHLCQAMTALLQEQPLDYDTLKKFAERIVSPSLFIDVPSTQWIEWGGTAKSRGCVEAALSLFEKGLALEKDPKIARRALYAIGEIRIRHGIEPEEGKQRLEKVLELDDRDLLATQAKKLLGKA